MHDIAEAAWLWVAKGAGAVAGSAISLAYVLPKGRREAAIRFAVGLICGLIFGGATGLKMAKELQIADELHQIEITLMGSAAASVAAWWAVGFVIRALSRGGTTNKDR